MSLTKKIMLPALIIAIAIAFTPVLNFAGLGADNAYAAAKIAAPKSVKATAVSTSAIKVTWKAVKENLTAVCKNGQFVGTKAESGVISYLKHAIICKAHMALYKTHMVDITGSIQHMIVCADA